MIVRWAAATFASLETPNYRRWFAGQAVSLIGTWMQTVAQGWLVLQLTGSGSALGLVTAAQFLPVLLLAPYGGVVVDRADKRRLLMATQTLFLIEAALLGALVVSGAVEVWMVVLLAVGFGLISAFDTPARQSFAMEMVGGERLRNAVTLNSVLLNSARAVGPMVAAALIVWVGIGICFLVNAATYLAVLAALARMERGQLNPAPPAPHTPGQLREGLRYVRRTPDLLLPLAMLALVGTLAYEFQVVLPLMAEGPFHGDAGTYGLLTAAMGAGAIVGGLATAGRGSTGLRPLALAAAAFGGSMLAVALSPTLEVGMIALGLVGGASITFLATANSTLQLATEPSYRGRVMSLWSVAFQGSTPIGAPIVGAVSDLAGPRSGLVLGAAACLICALVVAGGARSRRDPVPEPSPRPS